MNKKNLNVSSNIKLLLFIIPLVLVLTLALVVIFLTKIELWQFTVINIFVLETSFILGRWSLRKRLFAKEFIVSVFLSFLIFIFSFGGLIANTFHHIYINGNHFTLTQILLILINTFWTYFRGLMRIKDLIKHQD